MTKPGQVSWRFEGGPRMYGTFCGYTSDGLVRVRRGPTMYELPPKVVTFEMA